MRKAPQSLPLTTFRILSRCFVHLILVSFVVTLSASSTASSFGTSCSSSSAPIKSVVVVGGTHGNEYTGVWCIKSLNRRRQELKNKYPSLDVSTVMGNPKAHMLNKRFVSVDLNRQFTRDVLEATDEESAAAGEEYVRAREIDFLLGPKFDSTEGRERRVDVIIDCHSTTTNMGMTLIFNEGDALMGRAAAYVMHKCGKKFDNTFHCLVEPFPDRETQPFLPSTAKHGFTLEVGPVPQGVLRHDAVEKTQHAIEALLEFFERNNQDPAGLEKELADAYDASAGGVPCYRAAPPAATSDGATGKIAWPSDPENANFPAWLVHKDVQDGDFQMISTGDPLFVDLDGNVINYDGSYGSPVHLVFVNEGGYYYKTSGTGIGVALKAKFDLQTAKFIKEEES